MNTLQIETLRKDTPGCQHVLHFNNAGAALIPTPVNNAVKAHIELESMIGGYEAADAADAKCENFYAAAANLINCDRDEIAFLDNATRAWQMAFYSIPFAKGDRILTTAAEYGSNYLAFLHKAKQSGAIIDVIQNDVYGQLDIKDLQNKIDGKVKLIAITHVPTQGGLINPAEDVGKIANQMNIPYLLDATQSVGQMPIDVVNIGCDFLCATGRKFLRGPRGTGFLYAKKESSAQLEPPFIDLQSAKWVKDNDYTIDLTAKRFEIWEQNIAAKIGLGVAIDYANQLGMPIIWERIQYLSGKLRVQLSSIPSIELQDLGKNKCGIVTFTSKNKSIEEIQRYLASKQINVSISVQEHARLDLSKRNLPALIRASVHYYNTETEINTFCEALRQL